MVLNFLEGKTIAKMSMTSPIDANVPTRAYRVFSLDVTAAMLATMLIDDVGGNTLLACEANSSFVQWVANLNIKRNVISGFVNRDFPYLCTSKLIPFCWMTTFSKDSLQGLCFCSAQIKERAYQRSAEELESVKKELLELKVTPFSGDKRSAVVNEQGHIIFVSARFTWPL